MSQRGRRCFLCFSLAFAGLAVGCTARGENRSSTESERGADLGILFFGRPIVPKPDSMKPVTEWSELDNRDTLLVVVSGDPRKIERFQVAIIVEKVRTTEDDEQIVLGVDTVTVLRGERASLRSSKQWAGGIVIADLHPSAFAAQLPSGKVPANVLVTVQSEGKAILSAKCELLFD